MPSVDDQLLWKPFRRLYHVLQAANEATLHGLQHDLQDQEHWLLSSVAGFKPANEASRKVLQEGAPIPFKGGKLVLDKRLLQATGELSQLLVSIYVAACSPIYHARTISGGCMPAKRQNGECI